mmetsp:Transcript_13234/g.29637  ORF Transcript_13234/g.29637 Transcript_13234/m.29637 type:complete len:209 (-) Transcript_13234:35-661(-)
MGHAEGWQACHRLYRKGAHRRRFQRRAPRRNVDQDPRARHARAHEHRRDPGVQRPSRICAGWPRAGGGPKVGWIHDSRIGALVRRAPKVVLPPAKVVARVIQRGVGQPQVREPDAGRPRLPPRGRNQPRVWQLPDAAVPRFPGHARLLRLPLCPWLQRLSHLPDADGGVNGGDPHLLLIRHRSRGERADGREQDHGRSQVRRRRVGTP